MAIAAQRIKAAPVRKTIRVKAPQARAFEVFASKMESWWPPEHSILKSPCKKTVVEPQVGGRWIQTGEDGSECVLGNVVAWQPPSKLVLTWRLNSKFVLDDEIDSRIEVTFTPDGSDATVVELLHHIAAVDAEALATSVANPRGWTSILENYARVVAG